MLICGRCDEPIRLGQGYTIERVHGATGPGGTVHLHTDLCRRTPRGNVRREPAPRRDANDDGSRTKRP